METLYTAIGLTGVATVLFAYGALTLGKLHADTPRYQWLNIIGTTGILISLLGQWNLPAFIANLAWITIGIVSLLRMRRRKP